MVKVSVSHTTHRFLSGLGLRLQFMAKVRVRERAYPMANAYTRRCTFPAKRGVQCSITVRVGVEV